MTILQIIFTPGKSGRVFLNKEKEHLAAYFGELHPNIIKKLDLKTEALLALKFL